MDTIHHTYLNYAKILRIIINVLRQFNIHVCSQMSLQWIQGNFETLSLK